MGERAIAASRSPSRASRTCATELADLEGPAPGGDGGADQGRARGRRPQGERRVPHRQRGPGAPRDANQAPARTAPQRRRGRGRQSRRPFAFGRTAEVLDEERVNTWTLVGSTERPRAAALGRVADRPRPDLLNAKVGKPVKVETPKASRSWSRTGRLAVPSPAVEFPADDPSGRSASGATSSRPSSAATLGWEAEDTSRAEVRRQRGESAPYDRRRRDQRSGLALVDRGSSSAASAPAPSDRADASLGAGVGAISTGSPPGSQCASGEGGVSRRYHSASRAPMQPVPAAVTAWR